MTAVFIKLLNMSITAAWIVLAVILLRAIFTKAPKFIHCLLWCLVGLRLVIPFSFESVLSLVPGDEPIPQDIIVSVPADSVTGGEIAGNSQVEHVLQGVSDTLNIIDVITRIGSFLWLGGVIAMVVYAVVSYLKILKKVSSSLKIGKNNVYICDNIATPFILGVIRPKIYLPSHIKKKEVRYVMAHERAHLKRRDHLWKPIAFLILSVYWFNPFIWLGYILLCRDIELACDEKVVKDLGENEIFSYSETLLELGVSRLKVAACPLAFGEVSVRSRVKNILNYKKPVFWIIAAALVAGIAVGICFLTVRPDKDGNPKDNNDQLEQSQNDTDNNKDKKHEHEYDTEVIKTATCMETGEVLYKCKKCKKTKTEKTDLAEHTYESEILRPANCTENGEMKYRCTACGYEFLEETAVDKNAHKFNYDGANMLKFITCTEEGIAEYTCTRCSEKKQEAVPASGHTWDLHTACCVHEGYAEFICRFCKEIKKEKSGAPAHNWQYSTCTEPEYCKDCGLTRGEPDGHTVYGGLCDRCNQNIPRVYVREVRGFDMTVYVKRLDSEVYFTGSRLDMSDSDHPKIWYTISGNNTEYIHKIWLNVTVTDAKTGKVVSDGITFTDLMPDEERVEYIAINQYLPSGEYIVTVSNFSKWNEGVDG